MKDYRAFSRVCAAAWLAASGLGACGDLKPNTGGESAQAGSNDEGGSAGEHQSGFGGAGGVAGDSTLHGESGSASDAGGPAGHGTGGGTAAGGTTSSGGTDVTGSGGSGGMTAATSGGTTATGGATGIAVGGVAGSATGGATSSAGDGSSSGGLAGGRVSVEGGAAGAGGVPDGGAEGVTVHGRIVNAWQVPLAQVALTLADQELTTNDAGEFTAYHVHPPYDVTFLVSEVTAGGNPRTTDGWSFEGVTRSDPTFWVSRAGEIWSGTATFLVSGTGEPTPTIALGIGVPSGRARGDVPVNGKVFNFEWSGLFQTTGTAHAISFAADPTSGLPTAYQGYYSTDISGDGSKTSGNKYTLALTPPSPPIATNELHGNVTGGSSDRVNRVWLSFADHAAILLAEQQSASETFSYLIPELPEATVTVYASSGSLSTGAFALAHRSRAALADLESSLDIALPRPPTLSAPESSETLTSATVFRWETENPVSILTLIQNGPTGLHRIHVVTSEKSASVPESLSHVLLGPGDAVWIVEAQGLATSLDAATSPTTFIDPFTENRTTGPLGADGSYASSTGRTLVVPE